MILWGAGSNFVNCLTVTGSAADITTDKATSRASGDGGTGTAFFLAMFAFGVESNVNLVMRSGIREHEATGVDRG